MINLKILITLSIILLIVFIIGLIILYVINSINNNNKIETFNNIKSPIVYRILTSDIKYITTKDIRLSQDILSKYYSIFEVIETVDQNNYFFNIYYSYKTIINNQLDISNSIFTNSNINKSPITLVKPSNRPIPIEIYTYNKDGTPRTLLNDIINNNYIVVDFINQYGCDTKYRINSVKIAIDKTSIADSNLIEFYYSADTRKTTDPYQMKLNKINHQSLTMQTINNNINIYNYSFVSSSIDPPSLDDIIIHFNTINNVSLYYINIYGLPETEYNNYNIIYNEQVKKTEKEEKEYIENSRNNFQGAETVSADPPTNDEIGSTDTIINNTIKYCDTISFTDVFRKIIENNIPWGIYNGAQITITNDINRNNIIELPDLLGRRCRNAIINDPNNEINTLISNETSYYFGYNTNDNLLYTPVKTTIQHLKGSNNVTINFPSGSLPYKYTICAITRYTNPSSRNRIITSKNCCFPINFFMGHWRGLKNISHNNGLKSDTSVNGDTNWVVSCFKSTGNQNTRQSNLKYNTVLYNGEVSGNSNFGGFGYSKEQLTDTNNILSINGFEPSHFGLSYLIIWDQILTDAEIDLVSKNLINTLLDNSYKLPISHIQISNPNDGLSPNTAVNSAFDIINNTCSTINNYYWINILTSKQKIYCILDNKVGKFGGGWMLAMKGAEGSSTFKFNSPYWTTNNTLNRETYLPDILNDTKNEIKTDIFNFYKFSEILIIYNDPNFKNNQYYKTSYYKLNNVQNRGKYSLSEFFANNLNDFNYNNIHNNLQFILRNNMLAYNSNSENGCINRQLPMDKFDRLYLCDPDGFNYTTDTFSQQRVCKAFGINLNFNAWAYGRLVARIGAVFNENEGQWFSTSDVCGGIGLNGNMSYASGDYIGCCESSKGLNRSLPFLLFVR